MADFSPELLQSQEKLFGSIFEENGTIGICLADTSRSILSLGQFTDDTYCTNLSSVYHIHVHCTYIQLYDIL